MKKTILFSVCVCIFISLFCISSCAGVNTARYSDIKARNYLVVGLDDAAMNSDVISIVRVSGERVVLVQIPRDTYVDVISYPHKINHIVAESVSSGDDVDTAIEKLSSFLSKNTGIRIDGYIALRLGEIVTFVDAIGGVCVNLPDDMKLISGGDTVLDLKQGANILGGTDAVKLLRHRAGYQKADLDRLMAHSLFYKGLIDAARSRAGGIKLLRGYFAIKDDIFTSIPYRDVTAFISHRNEIKNNEIEVVMLPGEAMKAENGQWYYVLHKSASERLIADVFNSPPHLFDPDEAFLSKNDDKFKSIYNK